MQSILWLALVLALPALGEDVESYSDSGIHGPSYDNLLSDMERLALENPGLVETFDYGRTPKGRTLRMVVAAKPGSYTDRPALLISGAIHGNEYLGIEDRIAEALLKKSQGTEKFLNQGGVVLFIPVVNPDGYAARTRGNSKGKDLNRDWDVAPANFKGFKEPETRALSDKLNELKSTMGLRYEVTVDYHCCIGAVLHPWSYKKAAIPAADLARHQQVEALATSNLGIQVGTTDEVLGYAPLGTTKDYYYATYGARAFTYEGRQGKEKAYFDKHVAWWDAIARMVSEEAPAPLFSLKLQREKFFLRLAD